MNKDEVPWWNRKYPVLAACGMILSLLGGMWILGSKRSNETISGAGPDAARAATGCASRLHRGAVARARAGPGDRA